MNKAVNKVLNEYEIGKISRCSLIDSGISNEVFILKAKTGDYILKKIPSHLDDGYFLYLKYLEKHGIGTEQFICNRHNNLKTNFGKESFTLSRFIGASPIPWEAISDKLAASLGNELGKLFKLSREYAKKNKLKVEKSDTGVIDRRLKIGLVHRDLSRENILIKNNHFFAIIDFADIKRDYLIWEFAILLTQVFITRSYGPDWSALKIFNRNFKKHFTFNAKESKLLIPLMKLRNLEISKICSRQLAKKNRKSKQLLSIIESVAYKNDLIGKNRIVLEKIFKIC